MTCFGLTDLTNWSVDEVLLPWWGATSKDRFLVSINLSLIIRRSALASISPVSKITWSCQVIWSTQELLLPSLGPSIVGQITSNWALPVVLKSPCGREDGHNHFCPATHWAYFIFWLLASVLLFKRSKNPGPTNIESGLSAPITDSAPPLWSLSSWLIIILLIDLRAREFK